MGRVGARCRGDDVSVTRASCRSEIHRPTPQLAESLVPVTSEERHLLTDFHDAGCVLVPNVLSHLRSVWHLSSSPATVMTRITKAAQPHRHGFIHPNNETPTISSEISSVPVSLL